MPGPGPPRARPFPSGGRPRALLGLAGLPVERPPGAVALAARRPRLRRRGARPPPRPARRRPPRLPTQLRAAPDPQALRRPAPALRPQRRAEVPPAAAAAPTPQALAGP